MTPEQALAVIDKALAMVPCNRQDQNTLQTAVAILREVIDKAAEDS